jgi:hypothetical protein
MTPVMLYYSLPICRGADAQVACGTVHSSFPSPQIPCPRYPQPLIARTLSLENTHAFIHAGNPVPAQCY